MAVEPIGHNYGHKVSTLKAVGPFMPQNLINPPYTNTKFSIRGIILQHFKLFFYYLFSRAFLRH